MSDYLCLNEDAFQAWIGQLAEELDITREEISPPMLGDTLAEALAHVINGASDAGVICATEAASRAFPGTVPTVAAYAVRDGELLLVVRPEVQYTIDGGFQVTGYPYDAWGAWSARAPGDAGIHDALAMTVDRANRLAPPLLAACRGSRPAPWIQIDADGRARRSAEHGIVRCAGISCDEAADGTELGR